jgi:glutathione synthase/RimK-type ligase-like ATP-grasp enzyme
MKPGYRKSRISILCDITKDPDRKSLITILKELLKLTLIHREIPGHYFSDFLFKNFATGVENYLPIKRAARIVPSLNDPRLKEVLDNKLYFNLFYSQFKIALPKLLMYNHGCTFVQGNEIVKINTPEHFLIIIKKLFDTDPAMSSVFIKRIYSSSSGTGIYRIRKQDTADNFEGISEVYQWIIKSECLIQEGIVQHHELNNLNPSSVNTVRIDTLLNKEGNIDVLSAYLRMSQGNHYVDNIGSGGCMVGVNLESGTLKKYANPDFKVYGTVVYTSHPVTGIAFEGFELPFFEDVKALVIRAASLMPGLRIIGWDVAFSEKGPVIIEGNSDYGIRGNDLAYGGYLSHPLLKKVLEEDKSQHPISAGNDI